MSGDAIGGPATRRDAVSPPLPHEHYAERAGAGGRSCVATVEGRECGVIQAQLGLNGSWEKLYMA